MSPAQLAAAKRALVDTAGGFLRNAPRAGTTVCERCLGPWSATPLCPKCQIAAVIPGGPDLTGFVTYAGWVDPIQQSARTMHAYKDDPPPRSAHQTVELLAAVALSEHTRCPGILLDEPVTSWATVPSLPPKPHRPGHALNDIVRTLAQPHALEVPLTASSSVVDPRSVDPDHYSAPRTVAIGQHVLLIDDTWTSGGHVTSAAIALRAAGAAHVSVLVLARWLAVGFLDTTRSWASEHLTGPDFDPDVCPWTGDACP